ncbi:hypothetical protein MPSEU_000881900 [Mayamaea pseudoterrestris]|nr:hypothetical protein MPSEU_000881900 [Mayamaea pseudoterrestris]
MSSQSEQGQPAASADAADTPSSAKASSDNPFDFDVDFSKIQKRRERAKAAKEERKHEDETPILPGMDANDSVFAADAAGEAYSSQQSGVRRPNIVTRAKTTGTELSSKDKAKASTTFRSFFGTQGSLEESAIDFDYYQADDQPIQVGNRKIGLWPYDDYHLIQKVFYEKLAEEKKDQSVGGKKQSKQQLQQGSNSMESSVPIFSRPQDPQDISTAVQNLSLTEFERKAEARAIAIVSCWMFDHGLIDELLVHGGMTSWTLQRPDTPNSEGTSRSVQTQQSEEGVEVGQHGFPIEGSSKMDAEIAKLRNSTNRQLALINTRLNDGVAATGTEVQELVNAVIATKDDIGRLRELSTYVSNAGDVDQANQFMLTKYPKLKQAINARRNLARCFRELDFFSQIPSTCDRLREELQSCEWTAHEWSTLRSVCREHVELEIFLVEAEAGMKKRLEDDIIGKKKKRDNTFSNQSFAKVSGKNNHELIDRFLQAHVENVWDLGDEIRLRIMSGIATAFDLAVNNPAGMVALVEAVEVYQSANLDYKSVHGEEAGQETNLRFTDMRAVALGELYKDFETRGLDLFRELTSQVADIATDDEGEVEVQNKKFSAVLRAANELASEIGVVKELMVPCFPDEWMIEVLWVTNVAHVCSNNILQQIGGPEGHKLPDLTVTQLLDLVAWVETFREIIEESFPNIGEITSHRTYLDTPPKLLVDDNKRVDVDVARDSLAWINNTLWDVHDLAKDEFLYRTKEQTEDWLQKVYKADHTKIETAEGRLVTSLCEDVYAIAGVQLRTIRERLTRRSEALVQAVGVIFKNLYENQMHSRDLFCSDFETCCAASNDFFRMSEKCEDIMTEIQDECKLSAEATETLEEQSAALLGLYSSDAVYAAQKTHVYCFEPIEEATFADFFGEEWLNQLTNNELALTIVRTLDDFMEDLEAFLDEVMVMKALEAQITSSVNFYIKVLLAKSAVHNSSRSSYFTDNEKAVARMRDDFSVIKEYFEGLSENYPTLRRVIEAEFDLLEAVIEILAIASGVSRSDAQDFVLVLQKKVRNPAITKLIVGDLYHLMKPQEEAAIYDLIDTMTETMLAVAPTDDKATKIAQDRSTVPGLRLDHVFAQHINESTRKRPLKKGAMEQAEAALAVWKSVTSSVGKSLTAQSTAAAAGSGWGGRLKQAAAAALSGDQGDQSDKDDSGAE